MTINYEPPALPEQPDIAVTFSNGYIIIKHRKDSRTLKFTRIKTVSDEDDSNPYRTSYYRIYGA